MFVYSSDLKGLKIQVSWGYRWAQIRHGLWLIWQAIRGRGQVIYWNNVPTTASSGVTVTMSDYVQQNVVSDEARINTEALVANEG